MSMKKALPIGIEFFEEMITKDYFYIDKTLLIKEILDMKSKVTLITRPRRFGKTLNMSMLRCFLDVHQEQRELFDGFKIMQYQDIVETYQNKHPVILLSLKSIKEPTYDESLIKYEPHTCYNSRPSRIGKTRRIHTASFLQSKIRAEVI